MTARPIRVALYGDVDLNIIDGSAIWVQSVAEMLLEGPRCEVTLVLKAPERRDVVTGALRRRARLAILDPADLRRGARLRPDEALDAIERADRDRRFDVVMLRGYALARAAARREALRGRLWVTLTDIPQRAGAVTSADVSALEEIAGASRHLLAQTEELRAFLEGVVPRAAPKLAPLPPMIPASDLSDAPAPTLPRLVYAGKLAPLWGFLETVDAFAELRRAVPAAELHVIGDKIHDPRDDPSYKGEVERRLRATPGLVWRGGMSRAQTRDILREGGVGLSFRDPEMNESLELSTKILEYGAAGLAVILNRTPMHERLLGADYRLFVARAADLPAAMRAALEDGALRERAARACRTASESYTGERAWARLAPLLERAAPATGVRAASGVRAGASPGRLRLLVAGHDLKFFGDLRDHFASFGGVEIREDRWASLEMHDEGRSRDLLRWAEVVVCEWCLGNAVWYSKRVAAGRRLVIRFHRAEIETHLPSLVDMTRVERVVFVGPHFLRRAAERFGWPADKLVVIPNSVDAASLDRPKMPGAPFTLGMLGIVPKRKRIDRALDVLEILRAADPRFRLTLKGRFPWEHDWVWRLDHERAWFEAQLARIAASPLLRDAVAFEGFGPDVSSWLRGVGFMLSVSDDESFHIAVAEGMASRAVPVVLGWEGAAELYPRRWVHRSPEAAARRVLRTIEAGARRTEGEEARAFAADRYDVPVVTAAWDALILPRASRSEVG
ncbi:MAG: glycosyltransferase family 4 protein [Acidobacteria bacterium]|nr:glycosyltransferase family 4 protein [Acidobacteriota bacterium]